MAAARFAGVDEYGVEQTGMQASAFLDLYAPRGPSGMTALARVRGARVTSGTTVGEVSSEGISGTGSYREVLGHHVHAKRAFQDVPGYDRMEAFSVSEATLAEYGVRHADITAGQQTLFRALDSSGRPNTLTQHSRIAYWSMVDAGMPTAVAKQLVLQSQSNLIRSGVVEPASIPWGKKTP